MPSETFISARGEKRLRFSGTRGIISDMNNVISALDEYFCAHYSDYVRLSALEGYVMPEVVYVDRDGNIARRDSSCMRLCYQKDPAALLKALKDSLADTEFTFSFRFVPFRMRFRARHGKTSFAKTLPAVLHRCGETAESAGEKLDIEPRFWKKLVKGSLLPEKNTLLALALVCRMRVQDAALIFASCGFGFRDDNVRDVVLRYLIEQQIFSEELRDMCLAEYKITNLPIRRS